MVMRFEFTLSTRCWSGMKVLAAIFEFCGCPLREFRRVIGNPAGTLKLAGDCKHNDMTPFGLRLGAPFGSLSKFLSKY